MAASNLTIEIRARIKWWAKPAALLGLLGLVYRRGAQVSIGNGPWETADLTKPCP
jgi:hypothetical protein